MSSLKPIGSEKLTGQDKLKRIMEIARYNEVKPSILDENSTTEYSISLSDGTNYEIVKERQGYIIKKTISESETDYIEPMKNRKYYSCNKMHIFHNFYYFSNLLLVLFFYFTV